MSIENFSSVFRIDFLFSFMYAFMFFLCDSLDDSHKELPIFWIFPIFLSPGFVSVFQASPCSITRYSNTGAAGEWLCCWNILKRLAFDFSKLKCFELYKQRNYTVYRLLLAPNVCNF